MSDQATSSPNNIDYSESMNVGRVHESVKREKDVNQPGSEPVSLIAYLLLTPLLLLAGVFVGAYYKGDGARLVPVFDANLAGGAGGEEDPVVLGKKVFLGTGCAACHQPQGQGQPGIYPPLVGSEWVKGSDKRLGAIIFNGISGPIMVAGQSYNNDMPAQGPMLTPKKLAYLMSFLRHEWGEGASLVTPEQAKLIFEEYKDRTTPFTVDELEKLIPDEEMLPKVGSYEKEDAATPEGDAAPTPSDASAPAN